MLPIGMQIMASHFCEETVLQLAYQYEQKTQWRKHKPKL